MIGHQPTKTSGTNPPNQIKVSTIPAAKMPSIEEKELDIVAIAEQLNGLIDRYNALHAVLNKLVFTKADKERERLNAVLGSIEKAIQALCLRLTQREYIITP